MGSWPGAIGAITLFVEHLPGAKTFYQEVFGLSVRFETEDSAVFDTGEHVSKREGARWASQLMPEHAELIDDALAWRERPDDQPGSQSRLTQEAARCYVMDVQTCSSLAGPSNGTPGHIQALADTRPRPLDAR
jgi:catechol 2,3-dioxygenase-like lactoylglutathione lyase family enzyme